MAIVNNFGIHRQAEDSRRVLCRNIVVNLLLEVVNTVQPRHILLVVVIICVELERFSRVEHEVTQLLVQVGVECTPVPIVGHATTIHCFANQLFEGPPWPHFVVVFLTFAHVVIK